MPKKGRGEKPQRELTKRQLSRWQAQQKRQRIIMGAGIIAIVTVLTIILAGWYTSQYRPLHVTVITVNGAKFNMQYYVDTIRVLTKGQPSQYLSAMADAAVRNIEQNELVRQQAAQLKITVTDDAVKQKLKSLGLPDDRVHRDMMKSQLLAEKVRDDYLAPKQVPASTSQAQIMAMLLESERQATEVRASLEKGQSFAELAGLLSLDQTTRDKKGDLGWHPQDTITKLLGTRVPGDYAFGSEAGVLSQPRRDDDITKPLGYWLIKLVSRDGSQADVNAMLLGSEQEALDIRARLAAGDNFTALAKEFSQLSTVKDDGGVLNGITKGNATDAFDKFVFNADTKAGTLSDPIRDEKVSTKGGYWLVKVVEKADDRPLDDSDRLILKNKALDEWVGSLWTDPNNSVDDSYLDSNLKNWAAQRATSTRGTSG